MLNKRLLELIPKVFTYTAQAVFFQWLSLLCNIAFTISICRFINYCFYNKTFNSQILIETLGKNQYKYNLSYITTSKKNIKRKNI